MSLTRRHPLESPAMHRQDAVVVRKSSDPQEERSQVEGVKDYLDRNHILVRPDHWFVDTGSRHKSDQRADFQRLLRLVEAGRINRVFVWKQDRVGTADPDEWGHFRWLFRQAGSRIIETLTSKDLTAPDIGTRIETLVAADKSEKDQRTIATTSLRKKVSLAKEGIPLSKYPPFGFDKRYTDSRGQHLWDAHLLDNLKWLVTNPDGATVERERAPRKSKSDRIGYIPSVNRDRQALAQEIFRIMDEECVSATTIAQRLNRSGRFHYGKPWVRTTILEILRNPAYVGAVRFNYRTQAEFTKYDGEQLVEIEGPVRRGKKKTRPGVPFVVENCHMGLVDRDRFDRVQRKLADRKNRPQPPRRYDLWLRGVLVCGGCGMPMRTFTGNGKRVGYICGSYYRYNQTRSRLHWTGCTRNFIAHDDAERLIGERVGELIDETDHTPEVWQLRKLGKENKLDHVRLNLFLQDGIVAYTDHLIDLFKRAGAKKALAGIECRVRDLNLKGADRDLDKTLARDFDLPTLRKYFILFEEDRVKVARTKLAELRADYDQHVKAKVYATSDRERATISATLARLDQDIAEWEVQAVPLDDKLADLRSRLAERTANIKSIGKALTGSNHLRKAQMVRDLFSQVVLHFRPVQKVKIRDSVFEPEKTEWVSNLPDDSRR